MDRISRIISHPLWREAMAQLRQQEENREFCRHGTEHLLDVARLAYIENLEKHLALSKALIYAAALLHDIGRARQYLDGTPHHIAGVQLAEIILPDCGFSHQEQQQILEAISCHRESASAQADGLPGVLYRADKASRMCLFCHARPRCNWSPEKMNLTIKG